MTTGASVRRIRARRLRGEPTLCIPAFAPQWFRQFRLPGYTERGIDVYAALCSFVDDWGDDAGTCAPSWTDVADVVGASPQTVRKYATRLRDAGLINWRERPGPKTNVYRIPTRPPLQLIE